MPRNASGVYTLPAGNPVVTGTTITSSWANPTLSDIANEVTNSLDRAGRGSMTGQLKAIDGTVSAPGMTFGAELSTGWYRAAAGTVRLAILAAQVAQFNAAGASITGTLAVSGQISAPLGTVSAPGYSFTSDTNNGWWSPAADVQAWSVGGAEIARLNSTGFGVGVSPTYRFDVSGGAGNGVRYSGPTAQVLLGEVGNIGAVGTLSNHALQFIINSVEQARLNSTGFGVGGAPLGKLWVQMAASGFLVTQDADGFALIGGYTQAGGTKGFRVAGSNGLYLSGNGANVSNVIINSAGNVGVGLLPNTGWRAGAASLQLGAFACVWTQSNGAANIGFGLYESGTNTFSYLTTGDAPTLYSQVSGNHVWYRSTAGVAGGAVTLSESGRFDEAGRLRINGAAGFGGVPLAVKVGTNQQFGVLSATIGGTPTTTLAALTDAGISAPIMLTGSNVILSGNGGSTAHASVTGAGLFLIGRTSDSGYGVFQAASGGSQVADFAGTTAACVNVRVQAGAIAAVRICGNGTTPGSSSFDLQQDSASACDIVNYSNTRLSLYTNAVERFRISNVGQLFAHAIHNNSGGATGTTPMLASGTGSLTAAAVTNCSGVAGVVAIWTRVGNVVTLSGSVTLTITSSSAATEVDVTPVIPSGFTTSTDARGSSSLLVSITAVSSGGGVVSEPVGDKIRLTSTSPAGSAGLVGTFFFTAQYEVR